MQFSDPNAGNYGANPYGNVAGPFTPGMQRQRWQRSGRRGGCNIGCLSTILVLALLGALIGFLFNIVVVWGGTTIQVAASPTLIIQNQSYNNSLVNQSIVHIHAGEANDQIHISPIHLLNIPFGLQELYRISGDRRTVIYDIGANLPGTMDITVPTHTNLIIDTNSTTFEIEGITGRMFLSANNGELIVKGCHLTNSSVLSGNSGMITVTDSQLSSSVTIENNTAAISFQGSLEPGGLYQFASNGKPIVLTLPQNAGLHIDATTLNNGTITSNIPEAKAQSLYSGFELHIDSGSAPRASLSLYNNGGPITINEQGGQ